MATALGSAVAAMCVQLVDASDLLAIHMLTRILLRSSSTHEPSDPPLEVVSFCKPFTVHQITGLKNGKKPAADKSAPRALIHGLILSRPVLNGHRRLRPPTSRVEHAPKPVHQSV